MSRLVQQLRNTGSLTFAKILRPVFSFFLIRAIASSLGTAGHGQYTTVLNYILIFEIIAAFGIKRLVAREVSQNKTDGGKYFINACLLLIPIALVATSIMAGLVYFLKWSPDLMLAAWILAASLIASSINHCAEGVFVGIEKMHVVGAVWTLENIIRVGVSLLLLHFGFGLISLVLTYMVLKFVTAFYYFIRLYLKLNRPELKVDKILCRQLFASAKTFAIIVIFVTIYWKLDALMLKQMKGDAAVGVYDGAYRFFGIAIILTSSFVLSVFPLFTDFFNRSREKFQMIVGKTFKYFTLLAIPFVIIFLLMSGFLILQLFNSTYTDSVPVLQILIFAIIPYGFTEIFAHALLAGHKQKVDMVINGIGMLLNMALNFILIPKYSYDGAAIATLISIHLYLIIQILYIQRNMPLFNYRQILGFFKRLIVPTVSMLLLILLFYQLNVLFLSFMAPILFFILIWKLGVISPDDRKVISDLMKRNKISS